MQDIVYVVESRMKFYPFNPIVNSHSYQLEQFIVVLRVVGGVFHLSWTLNRILRSKL